MASLSDFLALTCTGSKIRNHCRYFLNLKNLLIVGIYMFSERSLESKMVKILLLC